MSGNFRKALGPIHGRIKNHIKQYRDLVPDGFDPNKLNAEEKAKTVLAIKRLCKKLAKAISDAEKYLEKWQHLINTSTTEVAQEETKAREKFFQEYGSIPDTLKLAEGVLNDGEHLLELLGASVTSSDRTDSDISIKSNLSQDSLSQKSVSVTVTPVNPVPQKPTDTILSTVQAIVPTTNTNVPVFPPSIHVHTTPAVLNTAINAAPVKSLYYPTTRVTQLTEPSNTVFPYTQVPIPTCLPQTVPTTVAQNLIQNPPIPNVNIFRPPIETTPTSTFITPANFQTVNQPNCISPITYPTPHLLQLGFKTTAITSASLRTTIDNFQNYQPLSQAELALMPHIKLEIFDGDLLKFASWWEIYFTLIHKKALDNVVKFQTLVNHLSGEAADLISGIAITDQNYKIALGTLIDTYGDSSPARHSLRNQLINMSEINGTRHPEDIAKCRLIIKLFRQLSNLGDFCDHEWAGQIIEQKLPRPTLSELYREFPEGTPINAEKILEKLEKAIKHEQRVDRSFRENRPNEYIRKAPSPFKPFFKTMGTINTLQAPQNRLIPYGNVPQQRMISYEENVTVQKTQQRCKLCPGYHFSTECTQYQTPQERKLQAQLTKACFNCLRKDHAVKDCPSTGTCRICQGRHHTAICTYNGKVPFRGTKQTYQLEKTTYQNTKQINPTPQQYTHKNYNKSYPQQQTQNRTHEQPNNRNFTQNQNQQQKRVSFNQTNATTNTATGCIGWEDFDDAYGIDEDEIVHTATFTSKSNEEVLKACFKIKVCNPYHPDKIVECFAVLDTCSTHSYCDPSLAQQLSLPSTIAPLNVKGIGKTQKRVEAQKCNLGLVNHTNIIPIETYGWKDFMSEVKRIPIETIDNLKEATDLPHPVLDKISVLIGQDKALSFLFNSTLTELPSGHKLVDIGIGKFVCGQGQLQELKKTVKTFATVLQQLENRYDEDLAKTVDRHHAVESLPFIDDPKADDSEIARAILNENITIDPETGRMKVPLLFKEGVDNLPSNIGLSTATLFSVWKKHKNDTEILQKIDDIFREQHKLSILELVGDLKDEKNPELHKHYLPHFPVITPAKKTTKVRVVVNGSAKTKNSRSLNDYIYPGPSTVPDMAAVLLRFRVGKIAISSDIEKAFLQIALEEQHRDYVRILWLKDITKPPTRDNIVIFRYARVPFGVNCSPFLLGGSISYHLTKLGTLVAEEIRRNIYVDNCLVFADSVPEAISKYREIRKIFADIKMNIREFISNSKEFNEFLEQETGEKLPEDTKVLGIFWHIKEDTLKITLPDPDPPVTNTKRKCLKVLASVPDVYGFLLPILLIAKLFFQRLWKSKITWDQPIDTENWEIATRGWKDFEYRFPRQIISTITSVKEMHLFSDASADAAAAVAYVKEYIEGETVTTIIFAKNRIKPLNTERNGKSTLTIPRMELIGLLIATRMARFLEESLDFSFESINIWTDSKICIQWLQNPPSKDVFVKNRIFEILDKGIDYTFRHIEGVMNPADVASRGCTPSQLLEHPLWWHGPPILKKPATEYPPSTTLTTERSEKPIFTFVNQLTITPSVVDCSSFHSFHKLIATVFYVFTYITLLKIKTGKVLIYPWTLFQKHQKTAENLLFIENWLIKQLQERNPPEIKDNKKFRIKQDEHGIYRCYGRLSNSDLDNNAKFPIWLPRKATLTHLIIDRIHIKLHHSQTRLTLAALRNKYWISQGRRTVESQIHKCLTCRREFAKPFVQPAPPPLPQNRVSQSLPFQHLDIDYFGPVNIKIGSERVKRWVALFTCLATRIIHLEIVENLTTSQFLHSLRRFIARRGQPTTIISDNATTFRLAALVENQARTLHHEDTELLDYCAKNGITWKNIPELAPWFGGAYERLVGLTKTALKRAMGRHIPQNTEFVTYIHEAEAIVNSRPLTYIQENEPNQQILRPIDFLLPTSQIGTIRIPPTDDDRDPTWQPGVDQEKDKLVTLWHSTQQQLDKFWNLWRTEYLQSLRENDFLKHNGPRSQTLRPPKLGEVVIIGETDVSRGQWRLGKIVELPSNDVIRTVKIQMSNKRILTRPVKLCFPLEVSDNTNDNEIVTNTQEDKATEKTTPESPQIENTTPERPRRSPRLQQLSNISITTIMLLGLITATSATTTSVSNDTIETTTSALIFFTAKCVKGGIQINQKLTFQHLEICSLFYCTAYNKPPDDGLLLLPSTITSGGFNCLITFFTERRGFKLS